MKKTILLLAVILTCGTFRTIAQCSPDLSIVTPGVYPDSLTNLDTGMVSVFYADTIQFKVYSSVPPVVVDSVRVMSISNLPVGFTTSSNPPGMLFPGGSNGCILISGIPPSPAQTYQLVIHLRFYGHIPVPLTPVVIDTADDDYRIVVQPFSGIQVFNSNSFDVSQNFPNPFNLQTEISFASPSGGKADFSVYDLLGREIIMRSIDVVSGTNKITLSSKYFKPGIYFYKLNFKNKSITKKMIVTAKP